MNSSTLGLENDCSLAKNFLSFKEVIGAHISSFFWFHSLYFGFTYSIGDTLSISFAKVSVIFFMGEVLLNFLLFLVRVSEIIQDFSLDQYWM